uniref:transport inhibitor response 1-like protein Os04g0395600 n=1 Tax=Erigeron canadensis TaxID=72917 RepID=UPI001CB9A8BB|nr:transport inhibitor response 1-like protein Os04g0395600 [Erigeron canadensis]
MVHLPETVVETIINNLTTNSDRNSASLVNKTWYSVDRYSRRVVYVSNCNAISPQRVIDRFPNLRSLTLKHKRGVLSYPPILVPDHDPSFDPWVDVLCNNCPLLERLWLKRARVSDQSLVMISIRFAKFKSLRLNWCSGFSVVGLSAIASSCSILEEFEVDRCNVMDNTSRLLSSFPETLTSLKSLNISCVKGLVNPIDLERLVARCPKLTTLLLNKTVYANTIQRILSQYSRFVHLGVGSANQNLEILLPYFLLSLALGKCQFIQSLSFFYLIPTKLMHAFYPICPNLVAVNLRYSAVTPNEQVKFISKCPNLRRLSVRGCIGDIGIKSVVNSCENLEELKVYHDTEITGVSEVGLIAISRGCQKLKSLILFCNRMTNDALITFAKNSPNVTCFKLIISTSKMPDHMTLQAFDHGFRAIVQSCKNLKKLGLSGLVTNDVFLYIGMYAERLEELSVLNGDESDAGLHYVFNGCKSLRKAEIRHYPYADDASLAAFYGY